MGGTQCRRHGATEVEKVVRSNHDCPLLLSDMRMNLRLCHHQGRLRKALKNEAVEFGLCI